jgi:hypothetical protein
VLLQCWPDNNDVGATLARELHSDRSPAFGPVGEGNSAPMQTSNQFAASHIDIWTAADAPHRTPSLLRRGLSAATADQNFKERKSMTIDEAHKGEERCSLHC